MSESSQDSADQNRPDRAKQGDSARGGAGARKTTGSSGDRRPSSGDRGAKRPYEQRDDRKSYGDRNQKRSYGSRDDRKPYGDRGERKPYGDRDGQRSHGARDDRKPYGDRGERKPYADRGERKPYGDRDGQRSHGARDDRKPYGDRGDRKLYADRGERKPYGDRDGQRSHGARDDRKPYGDRGDRKPYGARDDRKPYSARDDRKPYGDRGDRKPYSARDDRKPYGDRGDRKPYGDRRDAPRSGGHRDDEAPRERYGAADLAVRPRHDDPFIPERIDPRDLDKGARAELKTLSKENADWVARHLVAASELLEADPELAHRHAMSAARRAGRIAVVRETLAITAYATGDFTLALRELRTYRRISGSNDQLPLMVDSERGVGRPDRALEVGRAVDRGELPAAVQVGLAIAMSGARLDLEQPELALSELEIPQLDPDRAFSYSPALFSAYAEVLEELGRDAEAAEWRTRAARAEVALGGPAEAEFVEIFELEGDDEAEVDVDVAVVDAETEADGEEPVETTPAAPELAELEDPGAVLEDDVAAVLAEGEALDAEASSRSDGGDADGAVPHQD
ncbi:primosomal protein [Agromyces italicus]|uniref:primosomal protein n=1 Tax=Agromyces italicus TaxID=279572 RepID=UPI002012747A|nr:primosomal protein [Agromyces italicus]